MGAHKCIIGRANLFLGRAIGENLLHRRDAKCLLEHANHDKIRQMHPGIALLYGRRQDFHFYIIVDHRRGGDVIRALLPRQEVQILRQQHNHLVHIKLNAGEHVPGRQLVFLQKPFPFAQFFRDECLVVHHVKSCPFRFLKL